MKRFACVLSFFIVGGGIESAFSNPKAFAVWGVALCVFITTTFFIVKE